MPINKGIYFDPKVFDFAIFELSFVYILRVISELKEANAKLLTMSARKPNLVPTYVTTPSSRWGRVNPEALVGKRVSVRMCFEEEFEDFVIKEYSAKDVIKPFSTFLSLCLCFP